MKFTSQKLQLLFTSTFSTTFIKRDIIFLSKHFELNIINAKGLQFYKLLFKNIFKSNISFSWFLSTYSATVILLMSMLKRKTIVVIGGIDVAKNKLLSYGIWNNPLKSAYLKFAVKKATHILAVDQSLKEELIDRAKYNGNNISVVPTTVDYNFWSAKGKKSKLILMVANVPDKTRIKIKGVDFFYEIAKSLPQYNFALIGVKGELQYYFPKLDNLIISDFVEHFELLEWYRAAKIYCQLSIREGLPNSMLEAMSCGCIPIGTKVGGIKTLVNENGYFIQKDNFNEIKNIFSKAMHLPISKSHKVRNFIINKFNPYKREEAILKLLEIE